MKFFIIILGGLFLGYLAYRFTTVTKKSTDSNYSPAEQVEIGASGSAIGDIVAPGSEAGAIGNLFENW